MFPHLIIKIPVGMCSNSNIIPNVKIFPWIPECFCLLYGGTILLKNDKIFVEAVSCRLYTVEYVILCTFTWTESKLHLVDMEEIGRCVSAHTLMELYYALDYVFILYHLLHRRFFLHNIIDKKQV